MLMGEFERSIDAKGRLIIPAKFREQLGASFVLTRGMDGCLFWLSNRGMGQTAGKIGHITLS